MRLDKKKMIAAIIVACTTLFIAIGIHEKKDTRKQLKFGATYMTMNNPYFVNMDENIEESVQAKGDILITRDPLQDQKKQNEQIKDMINEENEVKYKRLDFEVKSEEKKINNENEVKNIDNKKVDKKVFIASIVCVAVGFSVSFIKFRRKKCLDL